MSPEQFACFYAGVVFASAILVLAHVCFAINEWRDERPGRAKRKASLLQRVKWRFTE